MSPAVPNLPLPLPLLPLTAEAFARFGEVIETDGRPHFPINAGQVQRFHDLAVVDTLEDGGAPGISLFVAQPYALPLAVTALERHPLSSQAFVPLDDRAFVVVVAPAGADPVRSALRGFVTNGRQGVNYARGVWHHVLVAVGRPQTFVVVDRIGAGPNCDVFTLGDDHACCIDLPAG
ncbi:ureidoglycolate lyase [Xylophilus sp. Kf1]|nr:ureidoglycolate lyase [Xylophilus sp. Kf1]